MPSQEIVQKAVDQIKKRYANYAYFFEKIASPDWIEPLKKKGFFRTPPDPVREGDLITTPFWPDSQFLARMAAKNPELVLKTILSMRKTDNAHVHEDFARAAINMPPSIAARWALKEARWVHAQDYLYFSLPETLGQLIGHLARGRQIKAALVLAKSLFALIPEPPKSTREHPPKQSQIMQRPVARFDAWDYEIVLKKTLGDLVTAGGRQVLETFSHLLDMALDVFRYQQLDKRPEDLSYIWRPAIEDHRRNERHDESERTISALVTAVRDAATMLAADDPRGVLPELINFLQARDWKVFQRIPLYLARVFAGEVPELVQKFLTSHDMFENHYFQHEYFCLSEERFHELSPALQDQILSWVKAGPANRDLDADRWRLAHLEPLKKALPSKWQKRYERYKAKSMPYEEPEFLFGTKVVWGSPTPKPADELKNMSVEEIVHFLRDWEPSQGIATPTPSGLGDSLAAVVFAQPDRFASSASQFIGLDPTYVRNLLAALRRAAEEGKAFQWGPVLALCRWAVDQPVDLPSRETHGLQRDPHWNWTRSAIADLLEAGFYRGPAEMPFALRATAWSILEDLAKDKDPTPEYEARMLGSEMDVATLAVNVTRGKALRAIIKYAAWFEQHYRQERHSGSQKIGLAGARSINPEVAAVLDWHLNPPNDPSLAVRAIYGRAFPELAWLDPRWTENSVPKILPHEKDAENLWEAAWTTYVIFCRPEACLFPLLQEEYRKAVEKLNTYPPEKLYHEDPDKRLGEHIVELYWGQVLELESPDMLMRDFFSNASDELCAQTTQYVGWLLFVDKRKLAPKIANRLQEFWNWRLETIQSAGSPEAHQLELGAFELWFASRKFDDHWSATNLRTVLKLGAKLKRPPVVIKALALFAPSDPQLAFDCLKLIVNLLRHQTSQIQVSRGPMKKILRLAIQSPEENIKEESKQIIHDLGLLNFTSFRDLLSFKGE